MSIVEVEECCRSGVAVEVGSKTTCSASMYAGIGDAQGRRRRRRKEEEKEGGEGAVKEALG